MNWERRRRMGATETEQGSSSQRCWCGLSTHKDVHCKHAPRSCGNAGMNYVHPSKTLSKRE